MQRGQLDPQDPQDPRDPPDIQITLRALPVLRDHRDIPDNPDLPELWVMKGRLEEQGRRDQLDLRAQWVQRVCLTLDPRDLRDLPERQAQRACMDPRVLPALQERLDILDLRGQLALDLRDQPVVRGLRVQQARAESKPGPPGLLVLRAKGSQGPRVRLDPRGTRHLSESVQLEFNLRTVQPIRVLAGALVFRPRVPFGYGVSCLKILKV